MKRAAVIGDPIAHSLSPAIFSFLSQELRHPVSYEAIKVKSEDLARFVSEARRTYAGFNVTIPHKETVISLLDEVSAEARAIGAVNSVFIDGEGASARGFNTDVKGFTEALAASDPAARRGCALVLGAGGSARAVIFALASLKYEKIYVLNKTVSKALRVVADMTPQFTGTKIEALKSVSEISLAPELIVNATSLGMSGIAESTGLSDQSYFENIFEQVKVVNEGRSVAAKNLFAFDLIYKPAVTPFVSVAQRYGARAINGLDMLAYQALESWRIWFGAFADPKMIKPKLTDFLRSKLGAPEMPERVFLTGFMGAGKSTVGKLLAKQLNWAFVDTDTLIERKFKLKVSELFQSLGEDQFRKAESEIVNQVCTQLNVVVALGGGTLIRHENLEALQRAGLLIYLSASSDKLHSRLKHFSESRPLLKHGDNLTLHEHIDSLLQVRVGQYEKATFEIVTDDVEPQEVASAILKKLGLSK